MKRIIALSVAILLTTTMLTGCARKKQQATSSNSSTASSTSTPTTPSFVKGYEIDMLYKDVNLDDYVTFGDYLGIVVDTNSKEYKELYQAYFKSDIEYYNLYKVVTEGTVEDGDVVNLDFEGKIDGKAFAGGTATGADLLIGSGDFIDDFEQELIGAKIGETRDVSARFPDSYPRNPDLAGKEAIFTCKINKINKPMTEDEAYGTVGYGSAEGYKEDLKKRAAQNCILETLCEKANIKGYPEQDRTKIGEAIYNEYSYIFQTQYGESLDEGLKSANKSVEDFKKETSVELMEVNMIMYSIFYKEKLELDEKIVDDYVQNQMVSQPELSQSYAVQEIVLNFLYEKATIK